MEISAKQLRGKTSQIIAQAARGTEVIITLRGEKIAKLISFKNETIGENEQQDEIFGLWQNQDKDTDISVEDQVSLLRKGRIF